MALSSVPLVLGRDDCGVAPGLNLGRASKSTRTQRFCEVGPGPGQSGWIVSPSRELRQVLHIVQEKIFPAKGRVGLLQPGGLSVFDNQLLFSGTNPAGGLGQILLSLNAVYGLSTLSETKAISGHTLHPNCLRTTAGCQAEVAGSH
jgi:hypothetical protein